MLLYLLEFFIHAYKECMQIHNKCFSLSDVPNPPAQVVTAGTTNPTNVTISWVYISSTRPFVSTAVDLFVVQLRTYGQTNFRAVASHSSGTYLATVTGLIPYSTNYIRVLAVNAAGSTPSVYLLLPPPRQLITTMFNNHKGSAHLFVHDQRWAY